ncbi:hypothetical protein [Acinetobacter piscicola]|uniref:hypothetical protein n=1 Tax=Acinetobacter piscicola TaxID=2006115 RepID=UPI001021E725|nr:hypothetical protein [Acinetobacter piscicola]RYL26177.1 hypothetical protein EWP19_09445 [Acinetobacter piscicola]
MRSWSLLFSAFFASIVSVFSLVIPFCLFLNFYHGDLFVAASARSAQRGIEVMLYLTPFLMIMAFFSFCLLFRCFKTPHKIFEIQRFFKVIRYFTPLWLSLIFLFQLLDGRTAEIIESLIFAVISLSIFAVPLLIGIWSGNYIYLKILNKKWVFKPALPLFRKYKRLQFPPL